MSKIYIENLDINFPLYTDEEKNLKKKIFFKFFKKKKTDKFFPALKNINLKINSGEKVGLVGDNGSGKTTLLRSILGCYKNPDAKVFIEGKIKSLIDLNIGMDEEATGYENIFVKLFFEGLKKHDILTKLADIIEFSELEDFIYHPIKTYSSGMKLRLAFSIISVIKSDIILMDEWLSVGDENFSKKANLKMNEMLDNSKILILASHNKELIQKVCNRIIFLNDGKIVADEKIK